ncbi:MAG: methyltransferase domain-containing protein [Candidatus Pacebacteria bacterium]|nr:methyltransferase domain-containing protein [Candidatus Paceibacterota bacterium]
MHQEAVSENHYNFSKYVFLGRWVSYWYQIKEVLDLRPNSLLVVGAGDEVVFDVISKYVKNIKTIDIDERLNPDIVGSVTSMPIEKDSFDLVLVAEVLEHLPFEEFEKCILEISRVSRKYAVISLPHFGPPLKFSFKLPFLKEFFISLRLPLYHPKHKFNGQHYWEMGKMGFPPKLIKEKILARFKILKEFVPYENQYHHFFVLEKNNL